MKRYMKILIAIAVILTLVTPSAGVGRVLAEEQNTLAESRDGSPEITAPADTDDNDSDTTAELIMLLMKIKMEIKQKIMQEAIIMNGRQIQMSMTLMK